MDTRYSMPISNMQESPLKYSFQAKKNLSNVNSSERVIPNNPHKNYSQEVSNRDLNLPRHAMMRHSDILPHTDHINLSNEATNDPEILQLPDSDISQNKIGFMVHHSFGNLHNKHEDINHIYKQEEAPFEPRHLKRTLTSLKVIDWVAEVIYIRSQYKLLVKLAYNTLEIKK